MSLFPRPDYIWFETSWKYKVTGLRSATADVSIIGHLSCQSVLEQKTRTLPVCLIQVLWSEISAKVVKCYWRNSSCSLLLSSRLVCFFYPAIDKVGQKHWANVSAGFLTGFRFLSACLDFLLKSPRRLTALWLGWRALAALPIIQLSPGKASLCSLPRKQNNKTKLRRLPSPPKNPNALSNVVSKTKR